MHVCVMKDSGHWQIELFVLTTMTSNTSLGILESPLGTLYIWVICPRHSLLLNYSFRHYIGVG